MKPGTTSRPRRSMPEAAAPTATMRFPSIARPSAKPSPVHTLPFVRINKCDDKTMLGPAAHARAVVHRDLKPENVIVTSEGRVKILDFGLAQTDPFLTTADTGDLPTTRFQTDPGMIVGTLGYMAPEQLKGELVTPSADIFSLGCILFEMVTSKRPFQRRSGAATIAAILTDDIPRQELNDAAPLELQRIIEGCVEKNPSLRFQSAKDLALTLRAIASSSAVMPADMVKSIARKSRRQAKTIDS